MKIDELKSRDELPQFFVDMGYKVGAEIGVLIGKFTEKFCKVGLKMYAIDPWIGFSGQGRYQKLQETQDRYYKETEKRLSKYENCTIIRKTSMGAVKDFEDNSLDFVFIDGDHRFRYIAEDIYEWAKKVRPGGIVSGHDYGCTPPFARNVICQVRHVVDAYVKTFKIEKLYLCEREKDIGKQKAESWLFLKK